ncbi:hypothetical protein ACIBH1_02210 [Nonomuraea sp. NPDC050663]|uniref:hypothetical protein n=1 Tax=Nonomuraea sp. NPDC050663 TaxID=3364370 RepID=UPI0037B50DFE
MPQDKYWRRGHYVRRRRVNRKASGWVVLAIAAVVGWFAVSGFGAQAEGDSPAPTQTQVVPAEEPQVEPPAEVWPVMPSSGS